MKDVLQKHTEELKKALQDTTVWHAQILEVIAQLRLAFAAGKRAYVAGNGGSTTLAQHLSDEMVGRYKDHRKPYPVVSLSADSAVLTCIANDYGYTEIFKRQIEALGQPGDIFIAYSTSGNSANIIVACEQAKAQGMIVIGFTGKTGKLKDVADYAVIAPAESTARIQEMDLHALHLICEAFETANMDKPADSITASVKKVIGSV